VIVSHPIDQPHAIWSDFSDYFVVFKGANPKFDVIDEIGVFLPTLETDKERKNPGSRRGYVLEQVGEYYIAACFATKIFCDTLKTQNTTTPSLLALKFSPREHKIEDDNKRWALSLPKIQKPTNDQLQVITHFSDFFYLITDWALSICKVRGTKQGKWNMYSKLKTLETELGTSEVGFLVYCGPCGDILVPGWYDPRMKGSKVKCKTHGCMC